MSNVGTAVHVHAMKVYGGVELCLKSLLTLALNGGNQLASHAACFCHRKTAPTTH
jgi:hypothetical protein